MIACVTNKYNNEEIYVFIESLGTIKLDYSKLGKIKIKKGDRFKGLSTIRVID